jgi:hypothetical protein
MYLPTSNCGLFLEQKAAQKGCTTCTDELFINYYYYHYYYYYWWLQEKITHTDA